MILVTKCPHCQTTFKVTEDQLKLYDGAVRCGVCQQIFNGADHLQTEPPVLTDQTATAGKKKAPPAVPEKTPAPAMGSPARPSAVSGNPPADPSPQEHETDDVAISLADEDINISPESEALFDALEEELSTISLELEQVTGQLFGNEPEEETDGEEPGHPVTINEIIGNEAVYAKPPVTTATTRFANLALYPEPGAPAKNTVYSTAPRLDDVAGTAPFSSLEAEIVEPDDDTALRHQRMRRSSSHNHEPDPLMNAGDGHHTAFFEVAEEEDSDDALYTGEPDFVRKGRQKKRRGFFSAAFLSLATIALLAILAVQCLYLFSDRIVVWWPPAEPAVARACNILACPRRLETRISALSIESSELQAIQDLGNKYNLSLLIRNSSSAYQSWPYIELTLSDPEKKPVARRVFAPSNYLPDANRIIKGFSPYSEESIRLYLEIKTEPNADYRVSLFYP